jgi:hypothetical protein
MILCGRIGTRFSPVEKIISPNLPVHVPLPAGIFVAKNLHEGSYYFFQYHKLNTLICVIADYLNVINPFSPVNA